MNLPQNLFKRALLAREVQIGLWVGLAHSYAAELLATVGFDWLLIDAEHAPNNPQSVLGQLQAIAPYRAHPIVRPVAGHTEIIKQYLDVGALTLLIPMIETAEQAAHVVAATRYPPIGFRGVGSALARASRWNQIPNYLAECGAEICVLVQVETVMGMGNLRQIAEVDGVDGVFFGPADLSASMGLLGQPAAPAVFDSIAAGIEVTKSAGKAAGTLASDYKLAAEYLAAGTTFVAVGTDTSILVRAASETLDKFRTNQRTRAHYASGRTY